MKSVIGLFVIILCFTCSCQSTVPTKKNKMNVNWQSGDANISGVLWLPEGIGPHPAIIVGHGSGRARATHLNNAGEFFSDLGFAFLSYDKRGVGNSEGTYVQSCNTCPENLNLLASDILNGIDFLRSRKDIDGEKIGLWGVSQAGWILPIVAAKDDRVKFSILISGPTVTTGEENVYSQLTGDGSNMGQYSPQEISMKLKEVGPHGFDPYPYLKEMDMPGLWLLGEKDESIPIPETVKILDRLITEDEKRFQYTIFPNANHGLYANGRRVPEYWEIQRDFLKTIFELD